MSLSSAANNPKLVEQLARNQMFNEFNSKELGVLAKYMFAYHAAKDGVVFREGETTGSMCLLLEGRLQVVKGTDKGQTRTLVEITPGKFIGEMSMIDGLPYSATVVASETSKIVLLSREKFLALTEEQPRIAVKLMTKICHLLSLRLRQTTGKLMEQI